MKKKIVTIDEFKKKKEKKNQLNKKRNDYTSVLQLKIALVDIKPVVWRSIQVPGNYTFWDLHCAIQDAMGWYDAHLHEFIIKNKHIAIPDAEFTDDFPETKLNERNEKIMDNITEKNQSFGYIYDFGDGWEHKITFEKILPREKGVVYPRCLKGKRACPPEDCGGPWGYENLLEIIKNPEHKEYEGMMEWLGVEDDEYDPEYFDPSDVFFYDPEKAWHERV